MCGTNKFSHSMYKKYRVILKYLINICFSNGQSDQRMWLQETLLQGTLKKKKHTKKNLCANNHWQQIITLRRQSEFTIAFDMCHSFWYYRNHSNVIHGFSLSWSFYNIKILGVFRTFVSVAVFICDRLVYVFPISSTYLRISFYILKSFFGFYGF